MRCAQAWRTSPLNALAEKDEPRSDLNLFRDYTGITARAQHGSGGQSQHGCPLHSGSQVFGSQYRDPQVPQCPLVKTGSREIGWKNPSWSS